MDGVTLQGRHDGVQRGEVLPGSALLLNRWMPSFVCTHTHPHSHTHSEPRCNREHLWVCVWLIFSYSVGLKCWIMYTPKEVCPERNLERAQGATLAGNQWCLTLPERIEDVCVCVRVWVCLINAALMEGKLWRSCVLFTDKETWQRIQLLMWPEQAKTGCLCVCVFVFGCRWVCVYVCEQILLMLWGLQYFNRNLC